METSDALPDGHDRDYTNMPEMTIRKAAAAAETKGLRTYCQMPEHEARDAALGNGLLQFDLQHAAFE